MTTISQVDKDILTSIYMDALDHKAGGKFQLKMARDKLNEWIKLKPTIGDTFSTAKMNLSNLHKKIKKETKKLTIIPIGLNNCCHWNSEVFTSCGYEKVLGFNLTACPCGQNTCFEIHTVNKKDGQFFDFTKDFNDETEKYFYPLETKMGADEYLGTGGYEFIRINKGCRCHIDWSRSGHPSMKTMRTNDEINEYMKMINEKPVIEKWVIDEDEDEDDHTKTCKKCGEEFEDWLNTDICDICYEALQ
jgi:hypothetical protein